MKRKPKADTDSESNIVTREVVAKAIEELEDLIVGFRSVLDEMTLMKYEKLHTSNWSSSGRNAIVLLGRSIDAIWTAIGNEKKTASKIKMMQEKNAFRTTKRLPKD